MAAVIRSGRVQAVVLFAVWMSTTWLLEGRIETFLRPEDRLARVIYALAANVAVGTVGAALLLSRHARRGLVSIDRTGLGRAAASITSLMAAVVLGLGLYALQGAPTWDPVILVNAYAQVFVVTVAEVVVCWALLGSTFEAGFGVRGSAVPAIGAAAVSSAAFGIYHYAHSAPFNTFAMVLLLTFAGLLTSAFFFVSRDVYATAVFHNFLGVFGVVRALEASGRLGSMQQVQIGLLSMAVVAIAVLIVSRRFLLALPGHQRLHQHRDR